MDALPPSVRIIQGLGIIGALSGSGAAYSLSKWSIPTILQAPPSLMLTQWRFLFRNGTAVFPLLGIFNFSTLAFSAFKLYSSSSSPSKSNFQKDTIVADWTLFAIAAVLAVAIIPFTLILIMPTNHILEGMEEAVRVGKKDVDGKVVKELVEKWGMLNAVRAGFPLAAGVLGLWAVLR